MSRRKRKGDKKYYKTAQAERVAARAKKDRGEVLNDKETDILARNAKSAPALSHLTPSLFERGLDLCSVALHTRMSKVMHAVF